MKTLLTLLLLIPSLSWSAEQRINLLCEYSHTLDFSDGKTTPTSGSASLTVDLYESDNGVRISTIDSSEANCISVGGYNDKTISGSCEKDFGDGVIIQVDIEIDRYSGEYSESFILKDKGGGLIHFGKCRVASKKF